VNYGWTNGSCLRFMQWLSLDCFITYGTILRAVPTHRAESFSPRRDVVFQKNNRKESNVCGITVGDATGLLRSIGCTLRRIPHHSFRLGESCPEKIRFYVWAYNDLNRFWGRREFLWGAQKPTTRLRATGLITLHDSIISNSAAHSNSETFWQSPNFSSGK